MKRRLKNFISMALALAMIGSAVFSGGMNSVSAFTTDSDDGIQVITRQPVGIELVDNGIRVMAEQPAGIGLSDDEIVVSSVSQTTDDEIKVESVDETLKASVDIATDDNDIEDDGIKIESDVSYKAGDSVSLHVQAFNKQMEDALFRLYFWDYDKELPDDTEEWDELLTEPSADVVVQNLDEDGEMPVDITLHETNTSEKAVLQQEKTDDGDISACYLELDLPDDSSVDFDIDISSETTGTVTVVPVVIQDSEEMYFDGLAVSWESGNEDDGKDAGIEVVDGNTDDGIVKIGIALISNGLAVSWESEINHTEENTEITIPNDNIDDGIVKTGIALISNGFIASSSGSGEKDLSNLSASDFITKRLVVLAGDKDVIVDGEYLIASYDEIYLLEYDSVEQTMDAYTYYKKHADAVEPDRVLEIASDVASDEETELVVTEEQNPIAALSEESGSESVKKADTVIALIDTGVQAGPNIIDRISLIDEALEGNDHGNEMVSAIVSQNPDAKILSIRAIGDDGVGTISSLVAAMEYAIEQKVSMINLSLYGKTTLSTSVLEQEILKAVDAGILVVGAAGNDGADVADYMPGSVEEAYIIGACDEEGSRLEISNYGATVDYNVAASSTSEAAALFTGFVSANGMDKIWYILDQELVFTTSYDPSEPVFHKMYCIEDGTWEFLTEEEYIEWYEKQYGIPYEDSGDDDGEFAIAGTSDTTVHLYDAGYSIKYSNYSTQVNYIDGVSNHYAFCIQPTLASPSSGNYTKYGVSTESAWYNTGTKYYDMELDKETFSYLYLDVDTKTYYGVDYSMPTGYSSEKAFIEDLIRAVLYFSPGAPGYDAYKEQVWGGVDIAGSLTGSHADELSSHIVGTHIMLSYLYAGSLADALKGVNYSASDPTLAKFMYWFCSIGGSSTGTPGAPVSVLSRIRKLMLQGVVPDGFTAYYLNVGSSTKQTVASWDYEETKTYSINLTKSSGNTSVTSGNSGYSLKGAEYTLYLGTRASGDSALGVYQRMAKAWNNTSAKPKKVTTGTTDSSGKFTISDLALNPAGGDTGTYYFLKETKASPGYELDETIWGIYVRLNSGKIMVNLYKSTDGGKSFAVVYVDTEIASNNTISITSKEPPITYSINLNKVSALPNITDGNSCYSLKGAEYTLYLGTRASGDSALGGYQRMAKAWNNTSTKPKKVTTGTTDSNGEFTISDLALNPAGGDTGTYYFLKETKASPGYELDETIWGIYVRLSSGKIMVNLYKSTNDGQSFAVVYVDTEISSGNTISITSEEYPGNDPYGITITKIWDGDETPTIPTLEGTQFTIKYYDGYYTKSTLPSTATRTWVFEVKEYSGIYMTSLDDSYLVSSLSDSLYYVDGYPTLPLGTITIQETKPAAGYTLKGYLNDNNGTIIATDSELYVTQIKQGDTGTYLKGGNEYSASDTPINGSIKIKKYDTDGKTALQGVIFEIVNSAGEIVATKTTDANGEILFDDLYPDVYTITETYTPSGRMLLKDPIVAEIPMRVTEQEIKDNNIDKNQCIYDEADDIYYIYNLTYEVGNSATFEYPMTGGMTTVWTFLSLVAGFILLVGMGAVMLGEKQRI